MKCVVCKKDIKEFYYSSYIYYNGLVKTAVPYYGSKHDMRKIKFGICDNCITKLENEKIIDIDDNINIFD
jgi:hypothetical protein